jgi:hypothetical protein
MKSVEPAPGVDIEGLSTVFADRLEKAGSSE